MNNFTFNKLNPRYAYTGQFLLENLLPIPHSGVTIGSNLTWDFSGGVLTLPSSGTYTSPVIAGGLSASGSGSNDFSGSTGTFKFPSGAQSGQRATVVPSASATPTLSASQSGGVFLFDRASGVAYTLPTEATGLYFDFVTTVLQTTGANSVAIATASVFMTGTILLGQENITPAVGPGPKFFTGNGTSHVKITSNATTTGGAIGSWVRLMCISPTLWYATGLIESPSGSVATPFST